MNYEEAMVAVQEGKQVTREGISGYIFFIAGSEAGDSHVARFTEELGEAPFVATLEDEEATNWVVGDQTGDDNEVKEYEYTGPMAKYKVIGEVFPLNEDGSKKDTPLEMDSIHELPEAAGDLMVEEGTMEKVVE